MKTGNFFFELKRRNVYNVAVLRMWEDAKRAGSRALALDPRNLSGLRDVFLRRYRRGQASIGNVPTG